MPYIAPEQRALLDSAIDQLVSEIVKLPIDKQDGAVNYMVTRVLHQVYEMRTQPSYFKLNRAMGVLEAAKQETYRRIVGPYEDGACERNGDVW